MNLDYPDFDIRNAGIPSGSDSDAEDSASKVVSCKVDGQTLHFPRYLTLNFNSYPYIKDNLYLGFILKCKLYDIVACHLPWGSKFLCPIMPTAPDIYAIYCRHCQRIDFVELTQASMACPGLIGPPNEPK